MPRIVLQYTIDANNYDRYCIWCDEVPPPLGGGPGMLVIPNVVRKLHGPPGGPNSYEYIEIPLLQDDSDPQEPEDLHIYLTRDPDATGKWSFPENGSRTVPNNDIRAVSIKLKKDEKE